MTVWPVIFCPYNGAINGTRLWLLSLDFPWVCDMVYAHSKQMPLVLLFWVTSTVSLQCAVLLAMMFSLCDFFFIVVTPKPKTINLKAEEFPCSLRSYRAGVCLRRLGGRNKAAGDFSVAGRKQTWVHWTLLWTQSRAPVIWVMLPTFIQPMSSWVRPSWKQNHRHTQWWWFHGDSMVILDPLISPVKINTTVHSVCDMLFVCGYFHPVVSLLGPNPYIKFRAIVFSISYSSLLWALNIPLLIACYKFCSF